MKTTTFVRCFCCKSHTDSDGDEPGLNNEQQHPKKIMMICPAFILKYQSFTNIIIEHMY